MIFKLPNLSKVGSRLTLFLIFFASFSSYSQEVPTDAESIAAGEKLFKANCVTCHKIQEKLIGPALESVYDRRDIAWIQSFVKNSQKMVADGDPIAVELFAEYNTVMTSFPFSDDQILTILAYVKDQTDNPPVEVTAAGDGGVDGGGSGPSSTMFNLILGGLAITLTLLLVVLIMVSSVLTKYLKLKEGLDQEEKELVNESFDFGKLVRSKAFIGIVAFVFTAIILKTGIDELYNIGVQQGYAPTQPIAFSHEIHAGQFEIDCQYCHTGVRKSKNANIPSINICMNCHGQIQTGTLTGTSEIAKIYDAWENNKPVEWVRVHNLPDLAYFNHQQHVVVGEIECQTCHGPIEEMAVVKQQSLLTMGWCIDCHRTTQIKTNNEYYDKLVELHDSPDPMTVEDIGGLECAKCHY